MARRDGEQEEEAAVRAAQPPSSEDDEAPEELSFGTARAEAEAARKLAGEAARRSKGNYVAVRLKDQNLTGLHQQTARDFVHSQLYGPGTNRTSGLEKKQRATKFTKYWVARRMASTV
ncbi:UNVERIFIED_CONTAM: hypothetical protein H355_008000 [Colinus virginianus]|nr:hypothetical protein H355_008000 [Colinus virginianus]